ncbi:hypothetical protein BP5796_04318 [Coleophoma crateriformis]|uniref:Uncharacterized protein n=1 Tax=Coleophoma crateriformis TaxID=565419 RepID=A0A3D8SI77_9HELO|nr:hypothetical protein BP5796_04318 [Coleophoma crateriformis]
MGKTRDMFKWAEVKERSDIDTWKGTTKYGNHDLYPIVPSEKKFGYLAYFAFWVNSGTAITTFTLGSSYIALGLNAGETIAACFVGALISSTIGYFGARPGQDYGIGYTVLNRMAFGMRGTYIPIFIIFIGVMVFAGIQAYYGAQALTLMLGAIFPSFKFMENTLPASAAITTKDLIGFVLYLIVYIPILSYIRPHQLRLGLYPAFIFTVATFVGILIWALVSNGGAGNLISSPIEISNAQKAYRFVQCVSSISGNWGGVGDRYSDWTRFEKKRGVSIPGLIGLPIVVTVCAVFGVLTTTATAEMYGVVQWNPILLLEYAQTVSYTPACRAATFFAGFGMFFDQIFLNLTQNSIPAGMDVAGALPRYFTARRASLLLVVITAVIQPWRFLSQAAIFVTILSSITIYFAAGTTIVLSDYWIIRKKLLKIPDLYTGSDGIYWYSGGFNLRCIAALFIGCAPCIPGFIMSCIDSTTDNAAVRIFQICWFVSAPLAFISYYTFNYFWPPKGLGIQEFIQMDEGSMQVIEGIESVGQVEDEKIPVEKAKAMEDSSV